MEVASRGYHIPSPTNEQRKSRMKMHTLIGLAMVLSLPALAQPTIDLSNNKPVDGQQFPVRTLNAWNDQGPAGVDVDYSFYGLITTTNRTYHAHPASYTATSAAIPAANMLTTDGGNDTIFWNYASDGLYQVGARTSLELVSNYSDPILELKYPCTYGTTWNDVTVASFTSPVGAANRTGTISGHADAYGTLGLSQLYEPNILRVKVRRDITDVAAVANYHRITNTYYFFREATPWPILKLRLDSVSFNNGGYSVDKEAQWMGGPGGVGLDEISADDITFSPYPNPTTGAVDLRATALDLRSVEVLDATGREVLAAGRNHALGANNALDLTGLPAGVYHVRITAADGRRATQRVVRQ